MSYITDELRMVLRKQTKTIEIPGQMMHEVLAEAGAQRRTILRGGVGAAFAAAFGGSTLLAACGGGGGGGVGDVAYGISFKGIPAVTGNTVVVPEGYTTSVLFSAGDAVLAGASGFTGTALDSVAMEKVSGGNHDGMIFFPLPGVDPNVGGLLAINHEAPDLYILEPNGLPAGVSQSSYITNANAETRKRLLSTVGVSVIEVMKSDGKWSVKKNSTFNKRYSGNTTFALKGPAAAAAGNTAIGTLNNCASGMTPWGTYLTCEETTDNYLDPSRPVNGYGWVVEIDPQGVFPPVKRTALGRFDHENTAYMLDSDNTLAIYMGDDSTPGCVYKFVATNKYNPTNRDANKDLLDTGKLYAAEFKADGTGVWKELTQGLNGLVAGAQDLGNVTQLAVGVTPTATIVNFNTQSDVLIETKAAARVAGATLMDRPEWVTVGPDRRIYCTFTNNGSRLRADAANPRINNTQGHIIRWTETASSAKATTFAWELFLQAGDSRLTSSNHKGNIVGDSFTAPDGIDVDPKGRLWVQTDSSTSATTTNTFGNNAMYSVDPVTKKSTRFLTGPDGCEITGLTYTPDLKTFFVNIQHPTTWPGTVTGQGKSSTIVIQRTDGNTIGS
ncbi:PhoX family phosphatase [Limnohabitans sp. MMS-10A-178]|uniref:PhoX family protein n=1 Tax=Limnohabitans sp. MMS-10A-178 TaxID=1835767 RepID=UPI000D364114|nr:PhoX family phosphatase [Limnohabitans sp. MMS-10A-178]PUE13762.1 dTDP-glucose 4,6-dehydratase [Limnohabitans sp. MMS-10A-178]